MKNPISEQFTSHLEFLGYKVEDISENEELDFLRATSERKSNLTLRVFKNDVVLISARYYISKPVITEKIYSDINDINIKTIQTKWSYYKAQEENGQDVMAVEACFYGYDKRLFGVAIDSFEGDIQKYMQQFMEEKTT